MTDTISKDAFIAHISLLEAAFMKEPPRETVSLYYERLNHITNEEMRLAVDFIIDTDHFFPSIARLKEVLPAPIVKQDSIEEQCS